LFFRVHRDAHRILADRTINIQRGSDLISFCKITRARKASDEFLLPPPPSPPPLSLHSALFGGQATSASEAAVSDSAKPSVKLAHHRLHLKTVMATPAIHWAQNFLIEQGEG
jgi:hypothetical protein